MKRQLAKLASATVLALVINAAVAYVCAVAIPGGKLESSSERTMKWRDASDWLDGLTLVPPNEWLVIDSVRHRYAGCAYTAYWVSEARPVGIYFPPLPVPSERYAVRCEAGWPRQCFLAVVEDPPVGADEGRWSFWQPGRILPRPAAPITRFTILWPALLTNLAVYFALTLAVTHFPRSIRSLLRLLRGRCRACGYSLTGLPPAAPCPECGRTRT